MKKLLLSLGLTVLTLASAHAQGTFNPLNGATSRVKWDFNGDRIPERNALMSDGLRIGVFIGAPDQEAFHLVGTMTIGSTAGLMVGLPTLFAPQVSGLDTAPGARISLRFASIDPAGPDHATTTTKTITLGPAAHSPAVVWGSTETATRFSSLILSVPEPSTLALGGLACAFLLFRLRKSNKQQP